MVGTSGRLCERWALAGLLHDLDYAETAEDFDRHGIVTVEELSGLIDDEMAHAILAILLASATAATFVDRRANNAVSHGR